MLFIDARPSVVTDERLARLRGALEAHPGDDRVLVVMRRQRVQLPVQVDANSAVLRREASAAFDGLVMVQSFDEIDAW
jgi:hypothetical protein